MCEAISSPAALAPIYMVTFKASKRRNTVTSVFGEMEVERLEIGNNLHIRGQIIHDTNTCPVVSYRTA